MDKRTMMQQRLTLNQNRCFSPYKFNSFVLNKMNITSKNKRARGTKGPLENTFIIKSPIINRLVSRINPKKPDINSPLPDLKASRIKSLDRPRRPQFKQNSGNQIVQRLFSPQGNMRNFKGLNPKRNIIRKTNKSKIPIMDNTFGKRNSILSPLRLDSSVSSRYSNSMADTNFEECAEHVPKPKSKFAQQIAVQLSSTTLSSMTSSDKPCFRKVEQNFNRMTEMFSPRKISQNNHISRVEKLKALISEEELDRIREQILESTKNITHFNSIS